MSVERRRSRKQRDRLLALDHPLNTIPVPKEIYEF
jgi:hypothetical protein